MGGIDTSKPKASLEKINTNWGQISSGSDGQAPVCTADELALKGGEITDQNTSDACRTQLNAVGADLRQVREDLRALVNGTYKVEGKNVTKVDKLEDVCPNLAALDPGTFGGSIGAFSTQAIAEGNACVKAAGNLYTTKDDAERAAKGEEAAALIVPVKVKPTTLQLVPEVTIATLWVELYTALAKHFGKDFTAMIELGKDPAVWKDYNSALAMLKNAVSRAIDTEADKVKTKAELVGNFPADLVALINKLPDGDEKAFYDMVVKPRVEEWMNDNIDYLSRELLAAKRRFEMSDSLESYRANYNALRRSVSDKVVGRTADNVDVIQQQMRDVNRATGTEHIDAVLIDTETPGTALDFRNWVRAEAARNGKTDDDLSKEIFGVPFADLDAKIIGIYAGLSADGETGDGKRQIAAARAEAKKVNHQYLDWHNQTDWFVIPPNGFMAGGDMFVGKDSFSFKPIVDVAPVISFYGNGTSTFQAGISTEALLTYSVPVTDDGRASGDLAKKGKSDFKLYLPAVASLFFAYRFGEAHESEVKLEVGLNDNDPRMTSGSYGRSQLASLIKYYGLNTGDVGFRVSARYQFIPDLAVYGRASYNPVADLSTDVTEKEAFHNSNQQSADVVVGIEYNGIENDSSPVSAFAQVQYMPEKIKDVGEWASNVGVAAGLKVKAADWLTIAAMGNYYMLDPNFAGFDSSWGAMGHLDFLVDKKSGLHIIPYGGYASATSPVTLGSSGTLTEGDRDAMYARNVAEAGVGFNFLKYFTIRAGWLRALIGTGNDYTNMGILGFTYIRK